MNRVIRKDTKGIMDSFLGAGIAVLFSLGTIAVMAWLLLSEKIGEGSIEFLITLLLLLSSFLGNLVSGKRSAMGVLPSCAITTAAILCIMLIGGFIADGAFRNVWLRLGAVAAGGLLSCGCCLKITGKRTRRKKRYR